MNTLKALQSETSDFPLNLPVADLGQSFLNLASEHDQRSATGNGWGTPLPVGLSTRSELSRKKRRRRDRNRRCLYWAFAIPSAKRVAATMPSECELAHTRAASLQKMRGLRFAP
jgi:hypothetical protein